MGVWCSCPMLRLTRNANQTTPSPNPHSTNHTLLSIHLSTNSPAPSYSVGKTKATLKSQFPATCSEKSFLLDTVVPTCLTGENTPLIFLVITSMSGCLHFYTFFIFNFLTICDISFCANHVRINFFRQISQHCNLL